MFNENGTFFKCIKEYSKDKTSIKEIEEFEKKYNLKLPEDYKEFLLKYNGVDYLDCPFTNIDKEYGLCNLYFDALSSTPSIEFYSTLKGVNYHIEDDYLSGKLMYQGLENIILEEKIIPIGGDLGNRFTLGIGYGENNFGYIYVWDLSWDCETMFVCKSFKELIEGYYIIEINDNCEPIEGAKKHFDLDNIPIENV